MTRDIFLTQVSNALITVLIVSSPALIVAIAVGVGVGLLQALTQVQDQSLPQAGKLVAVLLVIIIVGPLFATQIATMSQRLLEDFPSLTR